MRRRGREGQDNSKKGATWKGARPWWYLFGLLLAHLGLKTNLWQRFQLRTLKRHCLRYQKKDPLPHHDFLDFPGLHTSWSRSLGSSLKNE